MTILKLSKKRAFNIYLNIMIFSLIVCFVYIDNLNSKIINYDSSDLSDVNSHSPDLAFTIEDSVSYRVNVEFKIKNPESSGTIFEYFNIAHLIKRDPYQDSELLDFKISGYQNNLDINIQSNITYNDNYSNTFDFFRVALGGNEELRLNYKYDITVNRVKFENLTDFIEPYDLSSNIFNLYCNQTEEFYNITDPNLISASNSIVSQSDNPIEKAEKIFNWVHNYLTYSEGGLEEEEKGASWAYENKMGDCSEYSSLYITLLRIQKIPARKVIGFLLSRNPELIPKAGQSWKFVFNNEGDNFNRHAWTEYFVNGIGWIPCDPTWNYFNRNDLIRFTEVVGSKFNFTNLEFTEFASPGIPATTQFSEFDYTVRVSVPGNDLADKIIPILIYISIGACVVVVMGYIIYRYRKV